MNSTNTQTNQTYQVFPTFNLESTNNAMNYAQSTMRTDNDNHNNFSHSSSDDSTIASTPSNTCCCCCCCCCISTTQQTQSYGNTPSNNNPPFSANIGHQNRCQTNIISINHYNYYNQETPNIASTSNINRTSNFQQERPLTSWYRNINNKASNKIGHPFSNHTTSVAQPPITAINTATNIAANNNNDTMSNIHKKTQRGISKANDKRTELMATTRTRAASKSKLSSSHSCKGYKYKCCECKKTFKHQSNLKIHRVIHSEKALKCKYCNKTFARKTNLKQHERVHTGERPFECKICKRKFRQKHSLKDHFAVHPQIKM